ncbi:unnamed protein product [Rotaria sp. Silwood2]|nr:unnamed protein product [Rotaria sp. Silwood2]CAF3200346.1 unnamed protein product [Rotaria sp. Silwood2]CAF4376549.1 unnamed protein product [Rotaria sp. Silwood2]
MEECAFDHADEAEASVGNQWSKYYTNYTDDGRQCYYRCNLVKRRGPQCPASIYLLYHADSGKVTVYQKEAAHEHHNGSTRDIDENVKKCIENLFNDGIKKPKLIFRALQSRGINVPILGELEHWCEDNQNIPLDENESFVVSYKILYEDQEYEDVKDNDGNKFRIFISSIRLLNMISMSQHIHADATYKLVWQGFPVLVIGTTDFNKAFHPFGLAICSNEKTKDFEFIFKSSNWYAKDQ